MPGTKQEKAETKKSTEDLKAERQSDATDDEVLKEEEKGSSQTEAQSKDRTPSPDGAFHDSRKVDEAGPI
jgi:hypothetical protein